MIGWLPVQRGEGRPVALLFAQSVLSGLPRLFTVTAANTLFLAHFSAAQLPWGYGLSAIALALLGLLYVRMEKRRGLAWSGTGAYLLLALLLVVGRAAHGDPGLEKWAALLLIALAEVEFTLTNITFWSTANRLFTARQAARVFGLITTGEVLATVAGGLLLPTLLTRLAVADLLLIAAGAHLFAAALFFLIRRQYAARLAPAEIAVEEELERAAPKKSLREVLKSSYVVLLSLGLSLNVIEFYFVDNAFYHAASGYFRDEAALATFLGRFFVVLGVSSLLFRLFLSGRWRGWFGLPVSLLTTPACVAVGCLLVLYAATFFPGEAVTLLSVVAALKLLERLLVEGVNNPAYYALFQPLPAAVRTPAQNTLETTFSQAATMAASLLLLPLNQLGGGATTLAIAALVVLEAWLVVAWLTGRGYRKMLATQLGQLRLEPGEIRVRDAEATGALDEALASGQVGRVLYALELLEAMRHPSLSARAVDLLGHGHPRVAEAAARLLERQPSAAVAPELEVAFRQAQRPPRVRAVILRALAASAPADGRALAAAQLASDADPAIRASAALVLVTRGEPLERAEGERHLARLAREEDARARRFALRALAELGGGEQRPELARLVAERLGDPDRLVKREALAAVAALGDPTLLAPVVPHLADPSLRGHARAALRQLDPSPGFLRELVRHHRGTPHARQVALELLAEREDQAARAILLEQLTPEDRGLTRDALLALARAGFRPRSTQLPRFRVLLESELHAFGTLCLARRDAALAAGSELLLLAIDDELEEARLLLLSLLGAIHGWEPFEELRRQLETADPHQHALALEYLEAQLPRPSARRIMAAFEPLDDEARAQRLAPDAALPSPASREGLRRLAAGGHAWTTAWLATAARVFEGRATLEEQALVERVRALCRVELFRGLRSRQLAALAARMKALRLDAHGFLLRVGEPTSSLYVVVEGRLRRMSLGRAQAHVEPGESLGARELFLPALAEENLLAEGATRLWVLEKEDLDATLAEHPDAAWRLLEALSSQLRRSRDPRPEPASSALSLGAAAHASADASDTRLLRRALDLKATELFRELDDQLLATLAAAVEERFYEAGEAIVREGHHGASMFVLGGGEVDVQASGVHLARIAAPAVLGELATLSPGPRLASVTALGPVRALFLRRSVLRAVLAEEHGLLAPLLGLVLSRLEDGRGAPAGDQNISETLY